MRAYILKSGLSICSESVTYRMESLLIVSENTNRHIVVSLIFDATVLGKKDSKSTTDRFLYVYSTGTSMAYDLLYI